MAYGFVSIVHIVAVVLCVIELALTAYVASAYWGWSPDRVNFMIFNSIWSLLVLAYVGIAPLYYTRIFHRLASLVLEALTMIFWFAGSIALAVLVGAPECHGNTVCGAAKGAVAFGFFLWYVLPPLPSTQHSTRFLGGTRVHQLTAAIGLSSSSSWFSTPWSRCGRAVTPPTQPSPQPTPAYKLTIRQRCGTGRSSCKTGDDGDGTGSARRQAGSGGVVCRYKLLWGCWAERGLSAAENTLLFGHLMLLTGRGWSL